MIWTLPGEATVTIRKAGVVMTAEGHVYNSICTNPINTDKTLVGVLQESMRVPMRIHCKSVPQLRHALCLHVFLLTLSPKRNVFRHGSGSLQGGGALKPFDMQRSLWGSEPCMLCFSPIEGV